MKKKKLMIASLLIILVSIILTGCYDVPDGYQKNCHSREEALAFIQEYLDDSTVMLSEEYKDDEDENGFKLRIWEASYDDTAFHVASKQTWVWDKFMGEFVERYYALTTDYYDVVAYNLFNQYTGALNLVDTGDRNIEYGENVYFDVHMLDRRNFDEAFKQAKGFYEYIIKSYPEIKLNFAFKYTDSLSGEESGTVYVEKIDDEAYQTILGEYCVDKNTYLDASEFTKEEIASYIEGYGRKFIVTQNDVAHEFEDLNMIDNYEDVNLSYETMYEVLLRLGFKVSGSKENYSFTGTDGATYEISRSFVVEKEIISDIYYYLKNGKKVKMTLTYGYNNFIKVQTFEDITGMSIKEDN